MHTLVQWFNLFGLLLFKTIAWSWNFGYRLPDQAGHDIAAWSAVASALVIGRSL